jgi:hypothetical protein
MNNQFPSFQLPLRCGDTTARQSVADPISVSLPRICREDTVALDLDFTVHAEHFQKHRDALARRHDPRYQNAQAAHRAGRDDDIAARLRISGDFQNFVVADQSPKIGDHLLADFRRALAKVDDAGYTGERVNLAAAREVFKTSEEVTREKRFRGPKRPTGTHPAEANARREDFKVEITLQEKGDLVFLSGSGVEGEPRHAGRKVEMQTGQMRNRKRVGKSESEKVGMWAAVPLVKDSIPTSFSDLIFDCRSFFCCCA